MRRIAVDAMGGDRSPTVEISASLAAVRGAASLRVVLVGDEELIKDGLVRLGARHERRISVRHASQVIDMDDSPSRAVRAKRDSSMRACFELVKAGEADAIVSAGNSGAMLACALLVLGRIPGVLRPGIVTTFPTLRGACVLCDVGANVDPKPEVVAQLAVLGAAAAEVLLGRRRPRVGLLSNGEEESKGTARIREAHALIQSLARSPGAELEYVGPVEGKDVFGGQIDVLAADGFSGNVVLKTAEGAAQSFLDLLDQALSSSLMARVGAVLAGRAVRALRRRMDYAETGGAPLLGVRGVVVMAHGRSSPRALENAILAAQRHVDDGLTQKVAAAISRHAGVWSAMDDASVPGIKKGIGDEGRHDQ